MGNFILLTSLSDFHFLGVPGRVFWEEIGRKRGGEIREFRTAPRKPAHGLEILGFEQVFGIRNQFEFSALSGLQRFETAAQPGFWGLTPVLCLF
jgi:hypothetical protein